LAGVPDGAELPAGLTILRLASGNERLAYAAREVLEIANVNGALEPVEGEAALAGVALIEGEPAELVDCHALFARRCAHSAVSRGLTCRLDGEDDWMRNFLGPVIEAAGYRIVAGDEEADIAFVDRPAAAAAEDEPGAAARRAIRLRDRPEAAGDAGDSIYRYDRAALMSALLRAGEELAA